MTLLTACNQAAAELSLPQIQTVMGNTNAQAVQFLALVNRAGKLLASDSQAAGYWQQLRKQYTFQTVGYGPYTCTITPGSKVLTNVSNMTGIALGQSVYATGLVNDTLVTAINAPNVTVSQAPTATVALSGQSVVFAQEAYPFPADLAYLIPQTEWDRNFRWQLLGPLDAQEWQVIKSGISPVGPRIRFRIMGGMFYVNPVGSASTVFTDTIAYEYVSMNWVATAGAPTVPAQSVFQADTDVSLISEDLLVMSLKYRFLRAKGLDYTEEKEEFKAERDRVTGRAASSRNLPLNARASGIRLLNSQNVPDTGYGN